MSGFAAIWNFDGAPLDSDLLQTLTESLRFRGPDALRTWHSGDIGLGHTFLQVNDDAKTEEAAAER